ncbi:hypothetical protein HOLleu_01298 [Holothuria leucospilota]|uniref:Uncharacterized protein n=1 Tax=Holothuria leucospilota TaxID=206669 RepID=A0A9Q1CN90_HOLLE|nr:hypothetical protein HOLleu_01298 [Holothuria leucospilota]
MYLPNEIFYLKQALDAESLSPVIRDLGFRAFKGILRDSRSQDWEDRKFLTIALSCHRQLETYIKEVEGREGNLEWPWTSAIPASKEVFRRIVECLEAAYEMMVPTIFLYNQNAKMH